MNGEPADNGDSEPLTPDDERSDDVRETRSVNRSRPDRTELAYPAR